MYEKLGLSKNDMISCLAFAFFVVCPRMAGMLYVIQSYADVSMFKTVLIGIVIVIPLLRLMVYIFTKYGVWYALGFCVLTDLLSAFTMNSISINATIEIIVIAIFMILGVKLAPVIRVFITQHINKDDLPEN